MLRKVFRKEILVAVALLWTLAIQAQYTVTGGNSAPLLAFDDTQNRLQVWLVNGVENVTLHYTSGTTSHAWKRYSTKALEADPQTGSTQDGTTSTLSGIEDGFGYFVDEPGVLARYVWIIDYSRHAFTIQSMKVTDNDNPCEELWLEGNATNAGSLLYNIPLGLQRELKRSFEIVYTTLEWSAESKLFSQKQITQSISGNPFDFPLPPPLCDTQITLKGDLFARHFNMEKTISTDTYQAVALESHIDSTMTNVTGLNVTSSSDSFSAPLYVHLRAVANEPVANYYRWTIYQLGKDTIPYINRDIDFTFDKAGTYTIVLETSDRTRRCLVTDSISLVIGESFLDVPNVFSPGTTPGINDEFKVAYKSLVSFKCWIFNRWGVEIFHWTDPSRGWDGKKGGKYVSPGVYFYVIEAKGSDGRNYNKRGDINIIRSKNVHDQIVE
ncbi:hypothetical protein AGMMS49574_24540 [Bacteroidia bacterium]|nr:hypothetical protein AGMMS49574_24540 [Bacteroidia bacterium]GHU55737.1 hypothetical protein FACS189411_04790 [Bacteroidia bacterium]GHV05801.1 hypothetical protein FACS189416_5850 [Bacteroidia bacterium]